jgi:hypothetical protein
VQRVHKVNNAELSSCSEVLLSIRFAASGNKVKSKRISADRAHTIVMEGIAADDWHEQLLLLRVSRLSSDYTKDKQDLLKKLAEAPSGVCL